MPQFEEINAHKRVAYLCEEMAQAIYEECASRHNNWYAMNPNRREFVKRCAPTLRQQARAILADMLTHNDVSESEKEEIYKALLLDKAIPQRQYTLDELTKIMSNGMFH